MSPVEIAGLTLFILILFLGLFLIVFGLPGTILIVLDVFVYAVATGFETIGFKLLALLVLLACLAEALEFFLGLWVSLRFGLSFQGFWASVLGSIAGAALLTPVFFGLGTLAGLFLGGFGGAFAVEMIRQAQLKPAFRAGYGAVFGRMAGTLAKGTLGVVMIAVALTSIYS